MAKKKRKKPTKKRSSGGGRGAMKDWMTIGVATLTMRIAGKFLATFLGGAVKFVPPQYIIPGAVYLLTYFKFVNIEMLDKVAITQIMNSFWDTVGIKMVAIGAPAAQGLYDFGARSNVQTRAAINRQARLSPQRTAGFQAAQAQELARRHYRGRMQHQGMQQMTDFARGVEYRGVS